MISDKQNKIDYDYNASSVKGSTVVLSYFSGAVVSELDFYQITSDSVITNEWMVAITLIMDVKCPAFLFAVCCEERGIQIQDH